MRWQEEGKNRQGCYLCPKAPEEITKHKFIKGLGTILPYSLLERLVTSIFSTLPGEIFFPSS